jgi:hypothetical protein
VGQEFHGDDDRETYIERGRETRSGWRAAAPAWGTARWSLAESVAAAEELRRAPPACAHSLRDERKANGRDLGVKVDDVPSARNGRLVARSLLSAGVRGG